MSILQQPDSLSLSGNIKEFRIRTTSIISFRLLQGEEEIVARSYEPGADGIVVIDIRDIIHARLSFLFKNTSIVYEQTTIVSAFKAIISGTEVDFSAVRCGVDMLADTPVNFLTQNFLTWQPNLKPVTYYSPEFLTYYATQECRIKLRAYFTDESAVVISKIDLAMADLTKGKAYTIPLQYASVAEKLGNKMPAYYDVWIENVEGERLSYTQRYYASDMKSETEQWVLFENSLGGIDTFRAYGSTAFTGEHTHNIAEIDDVSLEYRVDTARKFQKDTGYLNRKERTWLLDFFPALKKYLYIGSYIRSIIVVESNVTYTDKELPSNYTFTYKFADAKPFLNLQRTDVPDSALDIVVPEVGSFTVPPRLIEFPRLPLSEGVLFPIQDPYSEKWNVTTTGSLANFIAERLASNYGGGGGVGHQHDNIDLLQLLTYAAEYLLVAGKKLKAGYADKAGWIDGLDDIFLHKNQKDKANALLEFLEGANVGLAVDDILNGKGTLMTSDGRIQTNRLEIRGALVAMELLINEIKGISGDWYLSDVGKIESVEYISGDTFRLVIEKSTDFDITTLDENDVLLSIVNNMRTGGMDHYSSWFRCVAKNVNDNALTVVLYSDNEVPGGKNYDPVAGYNVTRRGNAIMPERGELNERAQSWFLSSREGRIVFLQNVFKPILEDYNYALTIGKFPDIKALKNIPVSTNDVGVMAQTIVAEKIYQFDWNGDVVPNKVYRGAWKLEVAQSSSPYRNVQHEAVKPSGSTYTLLEQHTVSHYGCIWGCLKDKTIQEPIWNGADWIMLEGDSEYYLNFDSSNGWQFLRRQVDTDIVASVTYASRDITDLLMTTIGTEIEWLRDSGDLPGDNSWKPNYVGDNKNVIHLSNDDMPSGWGFSVRKVKFICRVFVPVGGEIKNIENYVGFQI